MSAVEYRRDIGGERLYASRNHSSLRHTYEVPGSNRTTLDWNIQLRQVRTQLRQPLSAEGEPELLTSSRQRGTLTEEHPDGPYHCESDTVGRYQNLGGTSHMLRSPRTSSGASHGLDWQLNLRDGLHRNECTTKWRRHYARPQQSFDMMMENCSTENAEFQKSHITPQDRRPDRRSGAISIETIREDPISFRRWAGCEGTQVGQWRHLIEDRSQGCKTRRAIEAETTMRGERSDPNGARISDNRSDGCIVEMLGKKRWHGARSLEPLAARPPQGDPKLYHLSNLKVLPEADERNRGLRMSKQPRRGENPNQGQ